MATPLHPNKVILFATDSLPWPDGGDGRTWSPESSSCGAAGNQQSPDSAELEQSLSLEWVEDPSRCSSVEEVQKEGGSGDKFYDNLGQWYKPLPEEEAFMAELLLDVNCQGESSYAVFVRDQEGSAAAAASARRLKYPTPPGSSPVSIGSHPRKEECALVANFPRDKNYSEVPPSENCCRSPQFAALSPLLRIQHSRLKRKRDTIEDEGTRQGRKKLRIHEVGFVTPSVVPAFNWVSPDGFTTMNAYLPSQEEVEKCEAFKFLLLSEEHEATKIRGCWCLHGRKMLACEMRSWRAFEQQQKVLGGPNRHWQSAIVSANEPKTTLGYWHSRLKLDNPSSCTIAWHMFQRRVHTLRTSLSVVRGFDLQILLAASLWVAAKLVDNIAKVPKASIMAATAGVPVRLLTFAELPLLDALRWKFVRY